MDVSVLFDALPEVSRMLIRAIVSINAAATEMAADDCTVFFCAHKAYTLDRRRLLIPRLPMHACWRLNPMMDWHSCRLWTH